MYEEEDRTPSRSDIEICPACRGEARYDASIRCTFCAGAGTVA